jgi:hypothetical protein
MFIIHGTYDRRNQRGMAADLCQRCGGVQRFAVVDQVQVPHLYFIPMPGSDYVASWRECLACRIVSRCCPAIYEKVLAPKEAKRLSQEEFVVATNPGLALPEPHRTRWMAAVEDLARYGGKSPKETLRSLALARLRKSSITADQLGQFRDRFGSWTDLSLIDRLALLAEAAATVNAGADMRGAYEFANQAMKTAPNGAGCLLAMPLSFVLGCVWLWLMGQVTVWLGNGPVWVWTMLGMGILAAASGIALVERCARRTYRAWFLKYVIAPAEHLQIDLEAVLRVFQETQPGPATPANVKEVLRKVGVLEKLVRMRRESIED